MLFEIAIVGIESNFVANRIDPLFISHTFIVLSADPDTTFVPSGVIATEVTWSELPSRVFTRWPEARSQTFTVIEEDLDTKYTHYPIHQSQCLLADQIQYQVDSPIF